jgi:hypothetical protein
LNKETLTLDAGAEAHLKKYLQFIYEKRNKFFGNGREVRKVIEESIKNRDLRVASMPKEQRTPEILSVITYADVEEFKLADQDSDGRKRIGFTLPGKEQ